MSEKINTPRKKRAKGPLRLEAIVPFLIFVSLVYIYFALFFDNHLRRALEFVGTYANGAEVNIADIDTSFWRASMVISNVQVTDVDQPNRNKIQIGAIRWQMLWDALLRGKVAINEASILEIGVSTPRKRPGRVLPKPPPGTQSATEKIRQAALEEAQERFSDNVLGDAAAILGGVDPKEQLKNIEASLASSQRIADLQSELKKKESEWKNRIAQLPKSQDLKLINERIKSVKLDGFKDPSEVQASLKELDTIRKDVDAKIKEVDSTSKAVGSDIKTYSDAIRELENLIKKDIADLEARLKIPKLDVKNLAMSVFGPMFLKRVSEAQFYMNKAREYLPPKKTEEEKAKYAPPKPRERIAGRNYKFGRPNAYPLFWLQKAQISSKSEGSAFSGDLTGTLRDLTDDPPLLGRPTVLEFKGDFKPQDIFGVFGELVIDHTTENAREKLTLEVGDYPIQSLKLVQSKDLGLGFSEARAQSRVVVQLENEEIDMRLNTTFSKIQYNIESEKKLVQEIITNVLQSLPKITLDASVNGSWKSLNFDFRSNLAEGLQAGFERELQNRIADAKLQIRNWIDEKVGAEKAKLLGEYKGVESQITSGLLGKKEEIDRLKSQIDEAKNKAVKQQGKRIEEEAKKGLDKLIKGGKLRF